VHTPKVPPLRNSAIVKTGITLLNEYTRMVDEGGLDALSPSSLLLFRSVQSLASRLEIFVSLDMALNGSMLSAADNWMLAELAEACPEHAAAIAALRAEIALVV
jgi:hypothetical protein